MEKNKFLKASTILIAGELGTKMIGFLYLAVLKSINEGIGEISGVLLTPYAFFLMFATLGIVTVLTSKLSEEKNKNQQRYKNTFINGLVTVLFTSTIIGLIFLFAPSLIMNSVVTDPKELHFFTNACQILSFSIVLYAINIVLKAMFFSKDEYTIVSISYISEQIIKILIQIIGAIYIFNIKDFNIYTFAYVIAFSITFSVATTTLLYFLYGFKKKCFEFMKAPKLTIKINAIKFFLITGLIFFVNSIFINGFSQVDLMMFDNLMKNAGYSAVEISRYTSYYFFWTIKLVMLPITLGTVFVTLMVKVVSQEEKLRQRRKNFYQIFDIVLFYSLIVTIALLTVGTYFYQIFYGSLTGIAILRVQSLIIPFYIIRTITTIYLLLNKRYKAVLTSVGILFVSKVLLNIILFRLFEINGLVYASIIACLLSMMSLAFTEATYLKLTKKDLKNKEIIIIKSLLFLIIMIMTCNILDEFVTNLAIRFIISSVIYLIVIILMNKKEISKIKKMRN